MKKRADGRFCKRMVINGKTKHFYGETEREVYRKIAEQEMRLTKGRLFEDAADDWWAEHSKTIEYNTAQCYRAPLKDVKKTFSGLRVTDILPLDVQALLNRLARQGLARQTVKLRLIVARLIFDYLMLNGEVGANPAASCKVPKNATDAVKVSASTEAELESIDNNADKPFGLFALLLSYTGMRRSEALALRWEDIDLQQRTIHVNKAVVFKNNKPTVKPRPKTRAGVRVIIIRERLLEELLKRKQSKGYLFVNTKSELLTRKQYWKAWVEYCKNIGIGTNSVKLRHAYSTALYEAGIDAKAGITQTGHSSTGVLENIYQEVRESQRQTIAEKLRQYDTKRVKSVSAKKNSP